MKTVQHNYAAFYFMRHTRYDVEDAGAEFFTCRILPPSFLLPDTTALAWGWIVAGKGDTREEAEKQMRAYCEQKGWTPCRIQLGRIVYPQVLAVMEDDTRRPVADYAQKQKQKTEGKT